MTTVVVRGLCLEVEGEGEPVVMVHGLGGTSNTFQPQLDVLRGHRVLRVDLPGAGRSPVPFETPTMESFAEAIVDAATALGVRRAHFVGHSMGTILCQMIAAARPESVASLTLFGPLTEPSDAMRAGLAARARTARHEGMGPIADAIVEGALSTETRTTQPVAAAFVRESVMRQDPRGYAAHCEALARAGAVDLRRIEAPALLVAGESDAVAPVTGAHALAERLKGASVAVIERSGHWLTIEKPRECNARLRDFLARAPMH